MKRACIGFVAIVTGVFLSSSFASATAVPPINPPQPGSYYYGDADGDTLLTTFDLGIITNFFNGQAYTYGTLQPDNANDDWNTSDIDSDNLLTSFDLGYFSNWFNGQALILADKPWILSAANLHVTYATTGAFFAFNANVSAYSGTAGRAGVAVTATVLPIGTGGATTTGSVGGRDCAAVDMFDVADPGAQCALAVTITDLVNFPADGLTESGTYGLKVMGDGPGTIAIQLDVTDNGLGIEVPTLSIIVTTGFPPTWPMYHQPTFSTAPTNINVQAGVAYNSVNGVVSDVDVGQQVSCASNGTNCIGFTPTVSGGPGTPPQNCTISFTSQRPQTCQLRVLGSDNYVPAMTVGATITITVGNRIPTFSTAPTNISVPGGVAYNSVNGAISDADIGQQVSCANGGTSCGFAITVTGGPGASPQNCTISFAPQAVGSVCQLRVRGSDNFAPAGTVGQTITVTVISDPLPFFATYPTNISVQAGVAYGPVTNGIVSDVDLGQQVSCAANGTSCGFAITVTGGPGLPPQNCTISFAAQSTPGVCNLRIRGSDSVAPTTIGITITVTIGNRKPTFSTAPTAINVLAGVAYGPVTNGVVSDVDVGQQVSCAANGTSCGFAITITGGPGASPQNCTISFAAQSTPGFCSLRVRGSDNFAPAGTVGTTILVTISNRNPTFSTTPTNISVLAGVAYGPVTNGVVSDADTGQQVSCAANGTSCGFAITITGGPGASPQNCTISFAAQSSNQICNLRVRGSDNFAPAGTVGATITVTIQNRAPTWQTAPSNITISTGSVYNQTDGTAQDLDTGQTLICSSGGTSCAGFTPAVSGAGASPRNCNVSFTAPTYAQTCNLRIRATDNGSPAASVGQTITITVNGTKNWTIMVFLDGDNNLEPYAINDFNEMEKGIADAIAAGNSDIENNMKVVVMMDRITGYDENPTEVAGSNWTDTRLYLVKADAVVDSYFRSERLDDGGVGTGHVANLGERNMGDPAQLTWFISHCQTYFPASHYVLVLWNHGSGVRAPGDYEPASIKAVLSDETSADIMYTDELQQVINARFTSGNKLAILGFDACLMGMVEVAYEFRNLVQYMVGSMHNEQGDGWDYDYWFSAITGATREDGAITANNMAILLVEQYREFIENTWPGTNTGETMAATDLTQVATLYNDINTLAVQMDAAGKKIELETLRDTAVHFYQDDLDSISFPFYDLYDFCNKIYTDTLYSFPAALKTAANNVMTSLTNAIVYSYGDDGNGQTYYYGPGSSTHRGLSIFNARGDWSYSGASLYWYEWWYTAMDTNVWWPGGHYYGLIDFCQSNSNGVVNYWRELFEKWYDPTNAYTPATY